jgi:tetratricopeptide (TPR) repeat protein
MHLSRSVFVLACLCLASSASALTPAEVFTQVSPSVAILETFDERGQRLGSYSATVIEAERLVAICEVLETAATLRVVAKSGDIAAKVLARDRDRNLCLIAAPGLAATALVRQTNPPATGSRVFALTNALGLGIGISEGVVSGIRAFSSDNYIQFTAPISPGSEGGALVDDSGRLVGIIDYRRRDGQNVNFASAAQWIGEIETRASAAEARLKRFDQAMALWKQQQWGDLQALALVWSKEEPKTKDAWRFVISAARGRSDSAAELQGWKALYQIDSSSTDVGLGLGSALLANGKNRDALDLMRQLLASHPEDASYWYFMGQMRQASGQLGDAEQAYRRAVELDPWLIGAYRSGAALAQLRGDNKTAVAIWERLSGLYSNQLGARLGLVGAYLSADKAARAWSTLAQIDDSESDSAMVWYMKGLTLARLGCPQQAIEAYQKSLERKLANPDAAWAGIGTALAAMSRYPEAIQAFRSAVQAAPDNDEWRYQLAINLKDGGRPGEALVITSDLVAKKPEVAQNWRQHGFVLAVLGRPEQAIPAMEKSLQIEPRQPKLWAALIETYQVAGRRQDARKAYDQLRALDGVKAEVSYREDILPYEENP